MKHPKNYIYTHTQSLLVISVVPRSLPCLGILVSPALKMFSHHQPEVGENSRNTNSTFNQDSKAPVSAEALLYFSIVGTVGNSLVLALAKPSDGREGMCKAQGKIPPGTGLAALLSWL